MFTLAKFIFNIAPPHSTVRFDLFSSTIHHINSLVVHLVGNICDKTMKISNTNGAIDHLYN